VASGKGAENGLLFPQWAESIETAGSCRPSFSTRPHATRGQPEVTDSSRVGWRGRVEARALLAMTAALRNPLEHPCEAASLRARPGVSDQGTPAVLGFEAIAVSSVQDGGGQEVRIGTPRWFEGDSACDDGPGPTHPSGPGRRGPPVQPPGGGTQTGGLFGIADALKPAPRRRLRALRRWACRW